MHPLLNWFHQNKRELPWRKTDDPYKIWLSEAMLQQTRVEQAIPYYFRFLAAFPTVFDLASAPLDEVLKQWEGLGYYARARNLHQAAQEIVEKHQGIFPKNPADALALKGVGAYTQAAVLSIAYGIPLAALDGNVIRVLSRWFCFEEDVKDPKNRKKLQDLADEVLIHTDAGDWNEAMMELGATICTPKNPKCQNCPMQESCLAFQKGNPMEYPKSKKKAPIPHQQIAVAVIQNESGKYLINRRPDKGLLGGLWEFPGGKQEEGESLVQTCIRETQEEMGIEIGVLHKITTVNHTFTHFKITLHAFACILLNGDAKSTNGEPHRWIEENEFDDFAFPKANIEVIRAIKAGQKQLNLF